GTTQRDDQRIRAQERSDDRQRPGGVAGGVGDAIEKCPQGERVDAQQRHGQRPEGFGGGVQSAPVEGDRATGGCEGDQAEHTGTSTRAEVTPGPHGKDQSRDTDEQGAQAENDVLRGAWGQFHGRGRGGLCGGGPLGGGACGGGGFGGPRFGLCRGRGGNRCGSSDPG